MSVRLGDVANFIEDFAPLCIAESWDNVGLLIGSMKNEVKRILVCLDVTSKVVDEAVSKSVDLIISHHPFIFKGFKSINREDPKGKIIYKLIQNNISVYATHTNLDIAEGGINEYLTEILELSDVENLKSIKTKKNYKIAVFVPDENSEEVREAMSRGGAGWIGNYSDCSFMSKGVGTFKPLEGSNPYIGSQNSLERVNEIKIETIVPENKLDDVISAMIDAHPYEEVAYDVYESLSSGKYYGLGKIGKLKSMLNLNEFIELVKDKLDVRSIRIICSDEKKFNEKIIEKVAVFCGSFDENLCGTVKNRADVLLTGDIKYHLALDMLEMGICTVDAGHFNTEHVIVSKLVSIISDKFPKVDVIASLVEIEPFVTR